MDQTFVGYCCQVFSTAVAHISLFVRSSTYPYPVFMARKILFKFEVLSHSHNSTPLVLLKLLLRLEKNYQNQNLPAAVLIPYDVVGKLPECELHRCAQKILLMWRLAGSEALQLPIISITPVAWCLLKFPMTAEYYVLSNEYLLRISYGPTVSKMNQDQCSSMPNLRSTTTYGTEYCVMAWTFTAVKVGAATPYSVESRTLLITRLLRNADKKCNITRNHLSPVTSSWS